MASSLLPEVLPAVGFALPGGPLYGGGEVADNGLEPDVDALAVVAVERDGNAPLDVTGDGAVLQAAFEVAYGKVLDVGTPVGLRANPVQQLVLERGELEEEVLGLLEDGGVAAEAAADVDELLGVEGASAVVALVAAGSVEIAVGTGALDVAVGEEATVGLAVGLEHRLGVEVAVLIEAGEDVLGDLGVVLGVRGGEQIEADAEPFPAVEELGVVVLEHLLGADAAILGFEGHGGAVRVAAGDHEDVVALHPVVSGEDVGRNVRASGLADVYGAVGVRPSHGNEDAFGH